MVIYLVHSFSTTNLDGTRCWTQSVAVVWPRAAENVVLSALRYFEANPFIMKRKNHLTHPYFIRLAI
jgi:hypothetical protein